METAVIDANFGVALVYPLPYSSVCRRQMENWLRQGERIAAPTLWDYEVASALRKQWAQNLLSKELALAGLEQVSRLPVLRLPPERSLILSALLWAERLGQIVAYDAQYLALAEHMQAQFWTADRKLHNRCKEIGASFVQLLGEAAAI